MFQGAITAIVTPFKNGKVDYESFGNLIEEQITKGIDGIVPCGTTGESPTLSHEDHNEVIRFTVEKVNKRVPVIAGTGSNNTEEAVNLTQHAKEVGADGALMVAPYYNKPSQKGMIQHYTLVADSVDIPIVLYNIQGRAAVNMTAETIIELSKHKNIVAVKEASGNLEQCMRIIQGTADDFVVVSGDDALTLPLCSIGGKGVISVISNIYPGEISQMVKYCLEGNYNEARKQHYHFLDLMKVLFIETSPVPVKQALHLMGKCEADVRLPLCSIDPQNGEQLQSVLKQYKLI